MLDRQAIFNKIWNHFIVGDGQPGISADGECVYGDPGSTNRCAIGIFDDTGCLSGLGGAVEDIDDNLLEIMFPGIDSWSLAGASDMVFLQHMQNCHDSAFGELIDIEDGKIDMHRRMMLMATKHNLTIPE